MRAAWADWCQAWRQVRADAAAAIRDAWADLRFLAARRQS
jgi:hypothetical protein